jgi:threonyl-tRNA synthetase
MELDILKPRHSLAHILAQAVQQSIDPYVSLGTWPAVDNGFYYDMIFSDWIVFGEDNLKELTKVMQGIAKQNQSFIFYTAKDKSEAQHILSLLAGPNNATRFKQELVEKFSAAWEAKYTFYFNTMPAAAADKLLAWAKPEYKEIYSKLTDHLSEKWVINAAVVTFADLCEWPHVESTKEIADGSFVLDKIAGAYRQANENNPQMTRIYGLAFDSKDALKGHLEMIEEAKKRDHRVIWQKMQLFAFDDEVGPGLPLWLPNWSIIVEEIERLAKEKEEEDGYQRVRSPHIAKDKLYLRSGHLPYYEDSMFPPMEMDGEKYYLKAMNCPHHHKIFGAFPKSYRDMPARYAEYGHCYRYEDSGSLFGLMRVRSLCMNDAHIYCTEDQFEEEFMKVIEMYLFYFKLFGIEKYSMRLSKHSKEWLGKKYEDNEPLWIKTEDQVRRVLEKSNVPFFEAENEAAFYGPKIDVQIRSAIGREFTLATNQLDFSVPAKFNLKYVDKDWQEKVPLCIHRAPLSTHERFIGFLIEHYAGMFPLWLAPQQLSIIPVAEFANEYAEELRSKAAAQWLRVKIDDSSDSFSKKIRNAELDKIPYILIVWEKEVADKTVSVRVNKTKEQFTMRAEQFIAEKIVEYKNRQ